MPDRVTVKVDLHGTEEALLQAGPKIAKRLFRRALKVVGELWVQDIKGRIRVLTGALRDSINYKISLNAAQDSGRVEVGPTYDKAAAKNSKETSPGVYGMFVEFGLKVKKYTFSPFMRPTFDATADTMVQIFAEKLREDLEDALKE